MGSFLGYAKGDDKAPLVSRIAEHTRRHNKACDRRWKARPWWIKVLFVIGIRQPSYDWALRQHLDRFYG